jgi:hypothetical protein
VGKFMQGISHGYLGLYFDKAIVVDETRTCSTRSRPARSPTYPEMVITRPIEQLDERDHRRPAGLLACPVDSWLYTAMTATSFVRLAIRSPRD